MYKYQKFMLLELNIKNCKVTNFFSCAAHFVSFENGLTKLVLMLAIAICTDATLELRRPGVVFESAECCHYQLLRNKLDVIDCSEHDFKR